MKQEVNTRDRREDTRFGGNGGLSLRKVSKLREVLSFQKRVDNTEMEDTWFTSRLGLVPSAKNANASIAGTFSVEDVWYEEPMGYHVNPGLNQKSSPDVWALEDRRTAIFKYCPEIMMILPMKIARERCKCTGLCDMRQHSDDLIQALKYHQPKRVRNPRRGSNSCVGDCSERLQSLAETPSYYHEG